VLVPLVPAVLAAPVAALLGAVRPLLAAPVGAAFAALAFGATLWGWASGGGTVDVAWAPSWDLRLHLDLLYLAGGILLVSAALYLSGLRPTPKPTPPGDADRRSYQGDSGAP
jgi:hypothetical protein